MPYRLSARDVGARIRARRLELGISQEELAARFRAAAGATTTMNTVGRWERTGVLTVAEARLMADVLGVPRGWLISGK